MATHEVRNQPPPLDDYDLYAGDAAVRAAVDRFARDAARAELHEVGALAGQPAIIELGFEANRNEPRLQTHDRFGHRIDEVRFHPSYHALMAHATAHGLHGAAWTDTAPHAHVRRAVKFYIWSQVESGHGCPISMTYAAVPALRAQTDVTAPWIDKAAVRAYDPVLAALDQKPAVIFGMGMTEKQGGSDVRANETRAFPNGDGSYLLTGHKWFCSAPMSDAFLVLAQAPGGLTCFLVPRVLDDGRRNIFRIARLKDKLGNRSNASSEIEFDETFAQRIGEEGRGVQTIVEMVNHTRLDCIGGSTALMRQALAQAVHHAHYRHAFGRKLADQPLMQNVLADIALETEAATVLLVRLAAAVDAAASDPRETAIKRLGTAIGKFFVCKRTPLVVGEALECLGGNGYVEENILPRLYRESPLNSIWEGSGNINALDVLRIVQKQPEALDAFREELRLSAIDARMATAMNDLEADLRFAADEAGARRIVGRMAVLWQAALLMETSPPEVWEAFISSRIEGSWGYTLGTLSASQALAELVERASPLAEHEASRTI